MIRGKYRILGKLGQGGMATVYKALHVGFDEVCALKVINLELASDLSFVKRFGQEAALTRKLQHPNAVRVEDIDEADDGRPFMVMEFIEGESLKDVIQHQAPLPVPRACGIVKQVAAALDAAHRLGMIHRDIKPGNILLTRSAAGAAGELAKVLDFGIAKIKEAHLAGGGATLTRTGTSIGTPAYMSPEQAMGKTGEGLDGRADLYSLGVVMYEMLTGDLPIRAESEVQMLIGQISTAPEPIRARRPELSEGIGAVVMRCLEKDPGRRPASGAALVAQIENFETGGAGGSAPDDLPTVATERPVPLEAASPLAARRLPRFVLVALIAIAIAIAGNRYLESRRKHVARPTPPVSVRAPAPQDAPMPMPMPPPTPAQQQVPAPASPAAKSPAAQPRENQDANPADDIAAALDAVPMDAANKAQVQDIFRQATALMKKGDYEGAAAQYQRLARLRPGWAPAIAALAGLAAKSNSARAAEQKDALNRTRDATDAIAQYGEALRLHPNVAINHYHLGRALGKLGDLDSDTREQQEALRINPDLAVAHAQLGYIHSRKESWSDAAREYREAIRLKPDLADAHSGLGDALGHLGDWQGEIAEERIAIQRTPGLATAHFLLATALEHVGDSSTALEEYRRAAELRPRDANFQANYKRLERESNAR